LKLYSEKWWYKTNSCPKHGHTEGGLWVYTEPPTLPYVITNCGRIVKVDPYVR